MKKTLAVILLSFGCHFAAEAAYAKAPALPPALYRQIETIQQLQHNQQWQVAANKITALEKQLKPQSYGYSLVIQLGVHNALQQGKPDLAIIRLRKVLAVKKLPTTTLDDLTVTLGQLLVQQGQAKEAVKWLQPWYQRVTGKTSAKVATGLMTLGYAYYQLGNYPAVIHPVKRTLTLYTKPPKNAYQLLLSAYMQTQRYAAAQKLLQQRLIVLYPKQANYWRQLSFVSYQLKDMTTAVATLELGIKKGILQQAKDVKQLVSLYLQQKNPYQAATLQTKYLKQGLLTGTRQDYQLLVNAWLQARERKKAVQVLENYLVATPDTEFYKILVQLYYEMQLWSRIEQIHSTVFKHLKSDKDQGAHLVIAGMAAMESEHFDKAESYFQQALKYSHSEKTARQWLSYLQQRTKLYQS
ncbi:tetratricopeptide repeat protein [Zooshikella sp. RANM57]|uniref:tetratricopeptide repeat protein n=1 Tax=Zooshikella sp. RANM57 TaxID=3425863 RepID=UPI003D6DD764